jgi:hypothetical protein
MSIRCREIRDTDIEAVVDLLTHGFTMPKPYWTRALQALGEHPTPPGFPKYGFVIDDEARIVGVVLLISTAITLYGVTRVRTNVSSWYVEPDYRSYAALLSMRATRRKDTTYYNTTPAPHTWSMLELQGFERFSQGKIVAFPAVVRSIKGNRIEMYAAERRLNLPQAERDLLDYHQRHGCLCMIGEYDGQHYPFVFCREFKKGFIPVAHVIYCRDTETLTRFLGNIGRRLLRHGFPLLVIDAEGPNPNLFGRFFGGRIRFRKGGAEVHIGDVAYSEQVLFGY